MNQLCLTWGQSRCGSTTDPKGFIAVARKGKNAMAIKIPAGHNPSSRAEEMSRKSKEALLVIPNDLAKNEDDKKALKEITNNFINLKSLNTTEFV